ncbi:MAG: bifunctional glutamate N-acetyltransferase/amino-acid acetyltransferase ArgJ [Armatimonadota bacterium]
MITYPKGFLAAGVRAGIKETGEDLALIYSETPASAAGVFTTNAVKAAPVLLSAARVPSAGVQAVVANSGNANACTGEQGMLDAGEMAARAAALLDLDPEGVLVASTGVIGRAMPMDLVRAGISAAANSLSRDGAAAARAIMTTDLRPKEAQAEVGNARIGGIAKGSGMICPNVATMLAFITTDAGLSPEALQKCLAASANVSFNCLTVDGDTSTNDTVLALANGQAGEVPLDDFQAALDAVCISLAKQVAADGEGATKMVEVEVRGAASFANARKIALTIANSPLVKTALFGNDPNWGRVLAAAGRAGVAFDPARVSLRFGGVPVLAQGEPLPFDEKAASESLRGPEVCIMLELGEGPSSAKVWTCDFSYDYVKINAEYHT